MLPVVAGSAETRRQILIYSLLLVPLTFLPAILGTAGLFYMISTAVLDALFLYYVVGVYGTGDGAQGNTACKKLFRFSILWLFLIFALILVERILGVAPFPPSF